MRFSITLSFTALLGMCASLPLTNSSTGPNVVDIETAVLNEAKNITSSIKHSTEEIDAALFGLLRDLSYDNFGINLDAEGKRLDTRGGPPVPRDRKVAEQMMSLPECFQTCFRNENGKVGVDIYNWDLNKFCYMPTWVRTQIWIMYHIRPCWKYQCRDHMEEIKWAGKHWMEETCP